MKIDKTQASEVFDQFLMQMDDQLDALHREAAVCHIQLDLSLSDLERLETLFDRMAAGASKDKQADLVVTFARHLGEVVRLAYGGKWTLPLADPKDVHDNTPVIAGHALVPGLVLAPVAVMRAYALRRKPGTLRRAVEADVRPSPLNLDDLIKE